MDSTPLPDHYAALGVDKTADAATIKKTYRRLVLSCHPDKVTDETLKPQKQEEFHKIQQAYEILSDDDKRATYEAELKLELLRKERAARPAAPPTKDTKSTRFDTRTDTRTSGAAYPASKSPHYTTEERKPSHAYDDDRRKYEDTYARPTPASRSSRPEKEPSARTARPTPDRTRSERTKPRDREDHRERKFASADSESSSSDEKARYEAEWKRRNAEEEARKQAADVRRKTDEQRRAYEDTRYGSASRKLSLQEEEAIRYQHRSRAEVQAEMRPSPTRAASRDHYASERTPSRRETQTRPEPVRRSSARPKDRPTPPLGSRERERGYPEIVDWNTSTFKHSASSPDVQVPRSMPTRAHTIETPLPREHRRGDTSPPPAFVRSTTMPAMPSSSSSRKKEPVTHFAGLREVGAPKHTSPERDHPSIPHTHSPATQTKHYYYPTPGGGVPLRQEDVGSASTHRTVLREPEHYRQRSLSPIPISRPPIGANRYTSQYTTSPIPPPPMGRSSTSRNVSPVRGRQQPLHTDVNSDRVRRESARRPANFNPQDAAYTKKIGPDDVNWASREAASKPGLRRTATYVC